MLDRKRIAFVVQRYGEEVNGGAELLTRWVAERLAAVADVHVITTCAVDHETWANAYPPGEVVLNGVTVHRFPVDAPRRPDFPKQTAALFRGPHTLFDEYVWMRDHGPYSTPFFHYIIGAAAQFDLFFFVTYLYSSTFFGLPLVAGKAVFIPTAHDEPYLRLPIFRSLFHLPRFLIYNTETEGELVREVMGNPRVPQLVAGVGVNVPDDVSAERFRRKYGLSGPFVLYVGRLDQGKNVPELLEQFARFRRETDCDVKLVLIGKANIPIPDHTDIIALGFVSEADKFDAIRAADVLIAPSQFESLSIAALEAWLMETPTLVNGRCEVLKAQSRQSNGGLYYHSYEEFAAALRLLLDDATLRARLGQQGRAFVAAHYHWDVVMAKYRLVIELLTGGESHA